MPTKFVGTIRHVEFSERAARTAATRALADRKQANPVGDKAYVKGYIIRNVPNWNDDTARPVIGDVANLAGFTYQKVSSLRRCRLARPRVYMSELSAIGLAIAILDPMKGPEKRKRCEQWKAARIERDRAFAAWLIENAERLGKLTRASRSAAKKEAWAALSPSKPPPDHCDSSETRKTAREARRAAWFAMKAEAEAEILRQIRACSFASN